MFESGDWEGSDDDEDDDDDDDDEPDGSRWNLEAMRRETERLRAKREEERLAKLNGLPTVSSDNDNTVDTNSNSSSLRDDDGSGGGGGGGSHHQSNGSESTNEGDEYPAAKRKA
jgi:hypothetical protein